jgi:hypothetical protein
MRDIVERLRQDAVSWAGATHTVVGPRIDALEREAADEIERLRQKFRGAVVEQHILDGEIERLRATDAKRFKLLQARNEEIERLRIDVRDAFRFAFWWWQGPTTDAEIQAVEAGEEEAWQEWAAGNKAAVEQKAPERCPPDCECNDYHPLDKDPKPY